MSVSSQERALHWADNIITMQAGGNDRLEDTVYIDLLSPEEEEKCTLYNAHCKTLFLHSS